LVSIFLLFYSILLLGFLFPFVYKGFIYKRKEGDLEK